MDSNHRCLPLGYLGYSQESSASRLTHSKLALGTGFEPVPFRLTGGCPTIRPPQNIWRWDQGSNLGTGEGVLFSKQLHFRSVTPPHLYLRPKKYNFFGPFYTFIPFMGYKPFIPFTGYWTWRRESNPHKKVLQASAFAIQPHHVKLG